MGELSFLSIIVSLAVCSLLVYAVFQYMKVRLTILEQSHKEQAMILQQYIEESATDIHRLYKLTANGSSPPQGSIILEYAGANEEANANVVTAYNEPHKIHLDTALFQNNRNLIEISSDSEDTTSNDASDTSSNESNDEDGDASNDSTDESDNEDSDERDNDANISTENVDVAILKEDIETVVCEKSSSTSPEIKCVTIDLGATTQEMQPASAISDQSQRSDVLSLLYKKAQSDAPEHVTKTETVLATDSVAASSTASATAPGTPLASLSVNELRQLLKEKYKHQPEKHAEIQKLKKVELIYALQNL